MKYTVLLGRAEGPTWYTVETENLDAWVREHVRASEQCAAWPQREGEEHYPSFPG